jgi:predicted transcriptional regulator
MNLWRTKIFILFTLAFAKEKIVVRELAMNSGLLNDDLKNMFVDFSDRERLEIFGLLYKSPMKQKTIKNTLNSQGIKIDDAELHRDLKRFEKSRLVKRNQGNLLTLTHFGRWIYPSISTFISLFNYQQYFLEHTACNLPAKFAQRIGALVNVNFELIDDPFRIEQKWIDIYENAGEYIYAAKSQASLKMIESAFEAITTREVTYNYILPKFIFAPGGRKRLLTKLHWLDYIRKRKIERHMLPNMPIVVILNEQEATAAFPDLNGKTDLSTCLYSKDSLFHEWCLDYFQYLVNNSDDFNESLVRE